MTAGFQADFVGLKATAGIDAGKPKVFSVQVCHGHQ